MKNIMKEAHNLTKKIIRKGDSYKATFRMCLSFVHSQVKKGAKAMLKGTEKQVKYANDIKVELLNLLNECKEINKKDVVAKWDTFKESKKAKFGSKEALIEKRICKINSVISIVNEITEAKEMIEKYKEVLNKDKYFKAKNVKEIAIRENWDSIISTTMQKIQNENYGK